MRFTKNLFALISSLVFVTSLQIQAQAPAQPPANPPQDDAALREALRKALGDDAPAAPVRETPATPATPVAPMAPVVPVTPIAPTPVLVSPLTTYPYLVTNASLGTTGVVALSLRDAIALALQNNLELQVFRYNPVISEYGRRALYSVYDPTVRGSFSRNENTRESGGINLNTGNTQPGTDSQTETAAFGVSGLTPIGTTYDLSHNIVRNQVTTPFLLGTNSFGEPVFGRRNSDTYTSAAALTVVQPLLRDLWIDNERLQIKLARRNVQIAELSFERQVMDIINRVEQAYYGLVAAREAVRVGQADVAVKKQFFDEQRRRVEVGILAPLDEKLAQAELAKSESLLIGFRGLAADAESVLKGLIQENYLNNIGTELQLTDRLLAMPATLELFDAFKEAMEKRPDLQQARLELEKARIRLKYDFNQLFPRLDAFGTLGYNGLDTSVRGALGDISDREFENKTIGLQLNFPLTMWGPRNKRKQDEVVKEQAILELKHLEDIIIQEVDFEVRLIRTRWAQIPYTREVTIAQQAALEAEKKKLDAGKSTSFNVLTIASDVTLAQVEEIRAILTYNQALAELAFRKGTTLERWNIDRPTRANK
jgi:outer membrane protein TolC